MTDHTVDVWKEIVSSLANKLNGELEHVDDLYVAIEELDSRVKSSADFIAEQSKTITDLLAQLEQREQEVADLTAKAQDAERENDLLTDRIGVKEAQYKLLGDLCYRKREEDACTIRELNEQLSTAQAGRVVWHPASEQPERGYVLVEKILSLTKEIDYDVYPTMLPESAVRWCYIDEVK